MGDDITCEREITIWKNQNLSCSYQLGDKCCIIHPSFRKLTLNDNLKAHVETTSAHM